MVLTRPVLACWIATSACLTGISAASAQGRLEAEYTASLAGLPLGKGTWTIDVDNNQYRATAQGKASGLLTMFSNGHGSGSVRGSYGPSLVPTASYTSTVVSSKKTDDVRVSLLGGVVKELSVEPAVDPDPERVPVTDTEKRGVMDPMSASILRVGGAGDPLGQEACQRTLPVFDGRMRYDLKLSYKRMDKVKAAKGYEGPVVVCAVKFSPVAGFIPSRYAIRYLIEQRDIEMWLAPIAGTRMMVPFRVQGPTPVGLAVLEATQFISTLRPTAASNTRTQ